MIWGYRYFWKHPYQNPSDSLISYFDPRFFSAVVWCRFIACKILYKCRLFYPSFNSFVPTRCSQVEAHKAAQKKIIEAYDPHKDGPGLSVGVSTESKMIPTEDSHG